jgi:hypothetical protein
MANVILYSQIGHRPFIWRPIACYTLARWIEDHGYTCQVIEFTHLFSPNDLLEYTKLFIDKDTLLVGVSSTMWTNYDSNLLMRHAATDVPENIDHAIKEVKNQYPKIKTAIGGPGQYVSGTKIFDFHIIDHFGENSLLKILDELSSKSLSTKLQRKNFLIEHQKFVYKDYDCILPGECLPIEWGRGCIFKCPFCRDPNLGKKPGTDEKDINLMVDEFVSMYENFGTTSYYFLDETFNANLERIENLGKIYNKLPFKLEFLSYIRADLLDKHPHTQDILQECGQRGALFGIETFHPEAAKAIAKPWSARRGKDFLLELREKWQHTHIDCHFIAGLPGESEEHLYETAQWLQDSSLGFFWFIPLLLNYKERNGVWERNALQEGVTWPNPTYHLNWERGEWSWIRAYNVSAKLNRFIDAQSRMGMWSLGPIHTAGLRFEQMVNHTSNQIFDQIGDLYDHEQRLFSDYKKILKSYAGR